MLRSTDESLTAEIGGLGALQLEIAVDEVALQRLTAAEEWGRDRDFPEDIPPDPDRIPIEAPRARRSISINNSTSAPLCLQLQKNKINYAISLCAPALGSLRRKGCCAFSVDLLCLSMDLGLVERQPACPLAASERYHCCSIDCF